MLSLEKHLEKERLHWRDESLLVTDRQIQGTSRQRETTCFHELAFKQKNVPQSNHNDLMSCLALYQMFENTNMDAEVQ